MKWKAVKDESNVTWACHQCLTCSPRENTCRAKKRNEFVLMVFLEHYFGRRQLISMAAGSSRTTRQFWLKEAFRACFFFYYPILLKWVTYWWFSTFSHGLAVPQPFCTPNVQHTRGGTHAPSPLPALPWLWRESFAQREGGCRQLLPKCVIPVCCSCESTQGCGREWREAETAVWSQTHFVCLRGRRWDTTPEKS